MPSTSGTCPSATTSPPTSATSTRARSRPWSGSASTAPAATSPGASCRTSPTRRPTSCATTAWSAASASPSCCRPRPRRRPSSSAPGRTPASCSRCRSSTATTASRTACATPSRACSSPTRPTRRASIRRSSTRSSVLDDGLLDGASTEFETADTAADDPAQLYYTSGTTGLAKGIVHAHRYVLAHEEFLYCHEVQDGERFHGMGEWAWAAGISPLLGPWRLGAHPGRPAAQGRLRPRPAARLPQPPRGHERLHHAHRDAGDDGHRGRRHPLPAEVPARVLGGRAAQPRGHPLVPRPVRAHRARLLRPHRELPAGGQLPLPGGPRGLDGPPDARLGRAAPRRGRAARGPGRARRDLPARALEPPLSARLLAQPGGLAGDLRRRLVSLQGRRDAPTRTATSGTRAAPTT